MVTTRTQGDRQFEAWAHSAWRRLRTAGSCEPPSRRVWRRSRLVGLIEGVKRLGGTVRAQVSLQVDRALLAIDHHADLKGRIGGGDVQATEPERPLLGLLQQIR